MYGPDVPSAAFRGLQMATGQTSGSMLWVIWFPFICGSKPPRSLMLVGNRRLFLTPSSILEGKKWSVFLGSTEAAGWTFPKAHGIE